MVRLEIATHDAVGLRAANPSAFTLSGTNSWVLGREPGWLIDPGPALPEHIQALAAELAARGGLGGIALTHSHADHSEAVPALREMFPHAPVAGASGSLDLRLDEGDRFGPLAALSTPGHAADHLAFVCGPVGFTGDAVLGQGSVFLTPDPGALTDYLAGLRRLERLNLSVLAPGHGPLVTDPAAKLREYVAHRLEREQRVLAALEAGMRTVPELLGAAWDEVPGALRPAAAVTLAAHLDKLAGEGRLPADVQRPDLHALMG